MAELHATIADGGEAAAAVVRGLVNHCIVSQDMPVCGLSVFRRDCKVAKRMQPGVSVGKFGTGGRRGVISQFSDQARYRFLHVVKNCDVDFKSMLTLTYPADFPSDGQTVKRKHWRVFSQWLKRRFPGIRGCWFLEFQKRGAPHFHVLLSFDLSAYPLLERRRTRLKGAEKWSKVYRTVDLLEREVAQRWFEIVNSGDIKHLRAGVAWEVIEESEGALRYAACHASKPHQKKVPENYQNVGAFWGYVGDVNVEEVARVQMNTETIFERLGCDGMSRKGRVKKYLWDAAEKFSPEVFADRDRRLKQADFLGIAED